MEAPSFLKGLFTETETYKKAEPIVFTKYKGKMIELIKTATSIELYKKKAEDFVSRIDQDLLRDIVTVVKDIRAEIEKNPTATSLSKKLKTLTFKNDHKLKFHQLFHEILRDVVGIQAHVYKVIDTSMNNFDWKDYPYEDLCPFSRPLARLIPFEVTYSWPKENEFVRSKENIEEMVKAALVGKRATFLKTYTDQEHNRKMYQDAKNALNTNVTFVIEGQRYTAHRSVIAAHSEQLARMCSVESEAKIAIEGLTAPLFAGILEFIYLGTIPTTPQGTLTTDYLKALNLAARKLGIYELSRLIEPNPRITSENIVDLYEEASATKDKKRIFSILRFAEQNPEAYKKLRESKSADMQKYLNSSEWNNVQSTSYNTGHKEKARTLVLEKYKHQLIGFIKDACKEEYKSRAEEYVYLLEQSLLTFLVKILNEIRAIQLNKTNSYCLTKNLECPSYKDKKDYYLFSVFAEIMHDILGINVNWLFHENDKNPHEKFLDATSHHLLDVSISQGAYTFYWQPNNEFVTSKEDAEEMIKAAVQGTKVKHDTPLHTVQAHNRRYYECAKGGKGTDITFLVGGKTFTAHHAKVSAHWPSYSLEIKGISAQAFEGVLEFIYLGTIPDTPKGANTVEFLASVNKAARQFGLYELSRLIEPNPTRTAENIVSLYKEAVASGNIHNILDVLHFAENNACARIRLVYETTLSELQIYMDQTIDLFDNIRKEFEEKDKGGDEALTDWAVLTPGN